MKAIVCTKYGSPDVLEVREVDKLTPKDDEALVKIHSVSINAADWHRMRGKPALARFLMGGFRRPKHPILGSDIAGRVEAVGKDVTQFQPGDEVFGALGVGGFAEYASVRESRLLLKPPTISFEAAATLPIAGVTALQALRDYGHAQPEQKVLINGASGGVGTFAVQLAKVFGAEVTAVCSTRNLAMARSIGADHIIDYTKEDFTRHDQEYDLIIDIAANHPVSELKRVLSRQGICVFTGFSTVFNLLRARLAASLGSRSGGKKFVSFLAHVNREDLTFLTELLQQGEIVPVIDKRYSLSETREAMRYFGVEHARGKVSITVDHCGINSESLSKLRIGEHP
jgi:NADPH:quinone reductase-like Zn-dependent oxidoreductase